MSKNTSPMNRPMRIQARKGSLAEKYYYEASALPGGKLPVPKAIAPGISPAPLEDLVFHGGKIVRQMEFQNIYLGRETDWVGTDRSSIDDAITRAMRDQHLNNVVIQYFHGFPENKMTCDPRASIVFGEPSSPNIGEPNVQAIATRLINEGRVKNSNLDSIIFNLILPRGIVLELDDSSSLNGLGGYHGSVHVPLNGQQVTIYYSANVFSELQPNGTENGIAVFDTPWKNVVGTLYHEMNEFRTDADVNDAIHNNDNQFLGWMSLRGREIGDQPIFAATSHHLDRVFKEITAADGGKKIPVQFLYSNVVHGAEGPISDPHT